uniref:PUB domain-containing protein n=1 Tax=Phaeomonas parva TaxID=124430 RepID=A0A7S1UB49_9STRA|mmetsp:Transcript_3695/g.10605  ORF Transcript_3695/g.10605 Transcript_3695/m.10605 type:complete len:615 (+) Transcript_3695:277-2121(+)
MAFRGYDASSRRSRPRGDANFFVEHHVEDDVLEVVYKNNADQRRVCICSLDKIMRNARAHPESTKFRRINGKNPRVKKMLNSEGMKKCMRSIGFVEDLHRGLFVLPKGVVEDASWMDKVQEALRKAKLQLEVLDLSEKKRRGGASPRGNRRALPVDAGRVQEKLEHEWRNVASLQIQGCWRKYRWRQELLAYSMRYERYQLSEGWSRLSSRRDLDGATGAATEPDAGVLPAQESDAEPEDQVTQVDPALPGEVEKLMEEGDALHGELEKLVAEGETFTNVVAQGRRESISTASVSMSPPETWPEGTAPVLNQQPLDAQQEGVIFEDSVDTRQRSSGTPIPPTQAAADVDVIAERSAVASAGDETPAAAIAASEPRTEVPQDNADVAANSLRSSGASPMDGPSLLRTVQVQAPAFQAPMREPLVDAVPVSARQGPIIEVIGGMYNPEVSASPARRPYKAAARSKPKQAAPRKAKDRSARKPSKENLSAKRDGNRERRPSATKLVPLTIAISEEAPVDFAQQDPANPVLAMIANPDTERQPVAKFGAPVFYGSPVDQAPARPHKSSLALGNAKGKNPAIDLDMAGPASKDVDHMTPLLSSQSRKWLKLQRRSMPQR